MDESTRGLDQSFEKIIVGGVVIEPKLLQHIVRFIITLLVPAAKIGAIKRMIRHLAAKIDIVAFEFAYELRNPLAFVHVGLNLAELRWTAILYLFPRLT